MSHRSRRSRISLKDRPIERPLQLLHRRRINALARTLRLLVRPTIVGAIPEASEPFVYVLENHSATDLALLDEAARRRELPSPLDPNDKIAERESYFFLKRSVGIKRKFVMHSVASRLLSIETHLLEHPKAKTRFVPVAVYWGRTNRKRKSLLRWFIADHSAISSGFRRLMSLFVNRSDVLVDFGEPLILDGTLVQTLGVEACARYVSRLLRVHFNNTRVKALGPELPTRQATVDNMLADANNPESPADPPAEPATNRHSVRTANGIPSRLTYPGMRAFKWVLELFWSRVYDDIKVENSERVTALAHTHTLVYLPCHRSHIDYLVVSYILFMRGIAIPYIAAGDNLNLPILGAFLRRSGAFFIRRSFRTDPEYKKLVAKYIEDVLSRGQSIEFFVEGTRSRTGRLLVPQLGLLKFVFDSALASGDRPLALVPIYLGYEKLVEADEFVSELSGVPKTRESLQGLLRSTRLWKEHFGTVTVRFGTPTPLPSEPAELTALGEEIDAVAHGVTRGINRVVAVTGVALFACLPILNGERRLPLEVAYDLLAFLKQLIEADGANSDYSVVADDPQLIVQRVIDLGFASLDENDVKVDAGAALRLQWFRNNVMNTLLIPSLITISLQRGETVSKLETLRNSLAQVAPVMAAIVTDVLNPDAIQIGLNQLNACSVVRLNEPEGWQLSLASYLRDWKIRTLVDLVADDLEALHALALSLKSFENTPVKVDDVVESLGSELSASTSNAEQLNIYYERSFVRSALHAFARQGVVRVAEPGQWQVIQPELANWLASCSPLIVNGR